LTRRLLAPAKLNLVLEVLGRRPDGFHELASVVHPISLYDELEIGPAAELAVTIRGADVAAEADLIGRAARALRAALAETSGGRIECHKRIPLASGLGGGSSDAAAALRLLLLTWGRRVSRARLVALAASIGSDVPVFLSPGAALVRGRGELVTPLPAVLDGWAIVVPSASRLADKTARLYAGLSHADLGDGSRAEHAARALRARERLAAGELFNAFEPAARRLHRGLAERQDQLRDATGLRFMVAGAGPSLFALAADHRAAVRSLPEARRVAPAALVVRLVARPRPR